MKKYFAMLLALVMLFGMVGCASGEKDSGASSTETKEETKEDSKDEVKEEASDEVVTIKWIQIGGGMPANYDAWIENLNVYLEEQINVNLEMEVISWGDWQSRRSVIVNTNEAYDIIFTNSQDFMGDITLGAYADITDIIKTETPDLYAMMSTDYWDTTTVNDKIYAVPTYKDSSMTNYLVWDKAIVDKYNVDIENNTTLESLTDKMVEIKEGEGSAPYILANDASDYGQYDTLGSGTAFIGVAYDDESRQVVSVYEQDDIMSHFETMHDWYNKGLVNSDAATLAEKPSYRMFAIAQGWSGAAKTSWGPGMGVEAVAVQYDRTTLSNSSVRGSLNAISANSAHPVEALKLLELANLDVKVRDALYYGLEGENFDYTGELVHKNNSDWTMAGYSQATFFTVSQTDDVDFNQWDEVAELNKNAFPSVMLGFTMDVSSVEDEIANCSEIYNRYKLQIVTGTLEPHATVADMIEEMDAAGLQSIIEEAQKQVDASYN